MTIVAFEHRGHRLDSAAVEHIKKQRGDNVVHLMAQRNLGAAEFFCNAIEDAAAQAGAQRTDVFARRDELLRDRIGVLIFDVISHALFLEPGFEQVRGTARNMLVDVHSDDVKVHRSTSLEFQ